MSTYLPPLERLKLSEIGFGRERGDIVGGDTPTNRTTGDRGSSALRTSDIEGTHAMESRRDVLLALAVVIVGITTVTAGLGWVALSSSAGTADRPATVGAAGDPASVDKSVVALHEAGVTGENVTVGVLDVTGYDLTRDEFEGRIAGTKRFGADAPAVDGGDVHGTAAASTIARVAPDSEIYFATFATPGGYEAALDWLADEGVDVVVTPVAQPATLGGGKSRLARVTASAVESGTPVVAPAGNIASGHWRGEYRPTEGGRHAFDGTPLNELEGESGRVEIRLAWERGTGEDYTVELHRIEGNETELIARSVRDGTEGLPSERLTAVLGDGRYAIAIDGPPESTGTRLRVASSTHAFARAHPNRSVVAPATAPGAVSVGAVDPTTGEIEPFSSRGPTADGRPGVDVVAPDRQAVPGTTVEFTGTSASAAFVGGVAALAIDIAPGLSPRELRRALEGSAAGDGRSAARGHGRVNPVATVRTADELRADDR